MIRSRMMGVASLLAWGLLASPALAQSPPGQPATGPGGRSYPNGNLTVNGPYWAQGHAGEDSYKYYIFEPAAPTPAAAPVVLFLHGWLAYNPNEYAFWMAHLVRKGYTVVWAQYDQFQAPWNFAKYAIAAWQDALARLANPQEAHVRPETDGRGPKTAMVGHSAGGYLSAILAAKATRWWQNYPVPRAVVAVEPGGKGLMPGEDFSLIDPATKLLVVAGEEDQIACTATATAIWNATGQIPDASRDLLLVQSDLHGTPQQIANHYFPNNSGYQDTASVDARDFYVTFKLSTAALNCTFRGTDCDVAFGNGSASQVDMGTWSDGVPLLPMLWVGDATTLPATCQ